VTLKAAPNACLCYTIPVFNHVVCTFRDSLEPSHLHLDHKAPVENNKKALQDRGLHDRNDSRGQRRLRIGSLLPEHLPIAIDLHLRSYTLSAKVLCRNGRASRHSLDEIPPPHLFRPGHKRDSPSDADARSRWAGMTARVAREVQYRQILANGQIGLEPPVILNHVAVV
jgi:hypothetical protein